MSSAKSLGLPGLSNSVVVSDSSELIWQMPNLPTKVFGIARIRLADNCTRCFCSAFGCKVSAVQHVEPDVETINRNVILGQPIAPNALTAGLWLPGASHAAMAVLWAAK